jgi:hypothetical protein
LLVQQRLQDSVHVGRVQRLGQVDNVWVDLAVGRSEWWRLELCAAAVTASGCRIAGVCSLALLMLPRDGALFSPGISGKAAKLLPKPG